MSALPRPAQCRCGRPGCPGDFVNIGTTRRVYATDACQAYAKLQRDRARYTTGDKRNKSYFKAAPKVAADAKPTPLEYPQSGRDTRSKEERYKAIRERYGVKFDDVTVVRKGMK